MSIQTDKTDSLSPVKRALHTLEKMQAKLDAVERAKNEPIAIIGMGCRFPGGADNPELFWKLLREGGDAITTAPAERWGADELARLQAAGLANICWGGFINQVDQFDPSFFGISGREAAGMDPQQRLLLEVAWEALERAGLAADRLAGSPTGVFIGICSSEYALYHFADREQIDPYASTGTAYSLVANRLSYLLDFQGPSIAIDTACSSSLVAMHLACQSLRSNECNLALAGGVNLILFSEGSISLAKWGMLAADGRCKTFDAAADGYVRGEGCGVVVLKRLGDALRDGDPIQALIRGSAVNQDGRSAGLTAPNLLAQQAVLRRALAGARLEPARVGYVEVHGTGTPLGDPIEVEALTAVYGEPRPDGAPCLLGSVKTNIGHLEAAAGVAGIIKTVLALQHRAVPPHLHFNSLNPNITLAGTPFAIPTALTPWPAGAQPRCAAISSFGFGGTNAHLLLEEAPVGPVTQDTPDVRPHLLMLSARSTEALRAIAGSYARLLREPEPPAWADMCFSANSGRATFPLRLALVAASGAEANTRLAAFAADEKDAADQANSFLVAGYAPSTSHSKVAFLFTGQGSQYPMMGAQLYQAHPVAREALDRCADLLRTHLDVDLRSLLVDPAEGHGALLSQTRYAQPALFALEWALAQLWLAWGVKPVLLLGHSLGELVAACLAGILSLDDALRLVVARGRLMQAAPSGAMAAIFAGAEVVQEVLPRGGEVGIAAFNSPTETVIAGTAERVAALVGHFEAIGVRTRGLSGSYAFHSPILAAIQPALAQETAALSFALPRMSIISTLTGKLATAEEMARPDYWVRQVTAPVLFAPALATLLAQGVNTLIEIGAHSTLLGMAQNSPQAADCLALPSLRRGADPSATLLRSLARLFCAGGQFDGPAITEGMRRRVRLPTYPFQRERFWIERTAATPSAAKTEAPARSDWYFVPRWRRVAPPARAAELPSAWLLLADTTGVAEALARLLRETGALVRLVIRAELSGECQDPATLGPAIASALDSGPDRRWGVVHLWSLDVPGGLPGDQSALKAALELSCGSALALVQALLGRVAVRLWLISRGAQPVRQEEQAAVALAQAPMWGLWRSAAQEHPELWGGLVDLDPESASEMSARGLLTLLQAPGPEQWALRAEQPHALRLEPYRPTAEAFTIDPDGSYLITGGLGGVGLALAQGLAARGVRHLALLSRHIPTLQQQAVLDALAAHGATAHHYLADVCDPDVLASALAAIRAVAPLKGIIHAAGVLDDGVVLRQSWERTWAVMAPKVLGSWALHQQTASDPLAWLVLCSSAAGLLGAPGQSSYAAANTWLDSLAALRQGQGAVGVSIAWGPWAAGGMQTRRPRAGVGTISTAAGIEALAEVGAGADALVAVLPLEPAAQQHDRTLPPLLNALAFGQPDVDTLGSRVPSALLQQIAAAAPSQRLELLREHLRNELVSVLGLPPGHLIEPQQGFFELGLDSLMAVELRNRLRSALGLASLSATLIFDYPTLDSLSSFLSREFLAQTPNSEDPAVRPIDPAEPLAIIGMSCRFPGGADSPDTFWQLLRDGVDAVGEVPPDRWDVDAFYDPNPDAPGKTYSRWGGFVRNIDQFDPQFFGITPREAMSMDPQQRLLLEVAWEALESAGQIPAQLLGSKTGVFIGIGSNDYAQVHMQSADPADIDVYFGTGNTISAAAGRLSYVLGLQGPSMSIDTACSSSLVALHLAGQSLRSGECNLAVVGGVQVMLSPATSIFLARARALATDSACKTFDANADGYVRGEGCGVVVLKRLGDAQRDGDPILAMVAGSAVNQDGRSAGFTVPNGMAQQAVIRAALAQSGIDPQQVGYVEAHGTGTPLGDPIELQALAAVLGIGRSPDQPLWVGSVKTNLGHLEAAAGMAGLIKTVLALRHRAIPPHLHFQIPNPHIPWAEIPVAIPTQLTEWTATMEPRAAGVSSFGISGTNAHAILLSAPAQGRTLNSQTTTEELFVLPLSARTPEALRSLARRYTTLLTDPTAPAPAAVAAAAAAGRSLFAHRAAIVAASSAEACAALSALADGRAHPALHIGHVPPGAPAPRVVFVCAGQGGQWAGMAQALLADPIAAATLQQVAQAAPPDLDWSLMDLLADPTAPWLERIDQLQPILFALQLALAARLQAWGVTPAAVVGHSFGEVAAAFLAAALTLPDAMRVICARSRRLAQRRGRGAMALVELSPDAAQLALAGLAGAVTIAGVNGPRSILLTGNPAELKDVVKAFQAQDIFARLLAVDVAAHSSQLDDVLPALEAELANLQPHASARPFYSTVTGQAADGAVLDAVYWARNLREPIQFWDAVQALVADGHSHFVELSPHPTLVAALNDGLRALGVPGQVTATLWRDRPARPALLAAIGALFCAGVPITWQQIPSQRHIVAALPTYPFQNERYWLESSRPVVRSHNGHRREPHHLVDWPGTQLHSPLLAGVLFETTLSAAKVPFLNDHRIDGRIVVAGAAHLSLALSAAAVVTKTDACVLTNIRFTQALILDRNEARAVQVGLVPAADGATTVQIYSAENSAANDWTLHAAGTLAKTAAVSQADNPPGMIEAIRARCYQELSGDEFYRQLWEIGYQLGPSFRWAEQIWRGEGEALCRIRTPQPTELQPFLLHPGLLDTCFQLTAASLHIESLKRMADRWMVAVPVAVGRLRLYRRAAGAAWCHIVANDDANENTDEVNVDIRLLDESGGVIAAIEGFRGRRVARADLLGTSHPADDWLYQLAWRPQPLVSAATPLPDGQGGSWLILADNGQLGQQLARQIEARGEHCVTVTRAELGLPGRDLGRNNLEMFRRLLADRFDTPQPRCRGIVHMWSLDAPQELITAALDVAQELGSVSTLHLVQALAQTGWRDAPRLWLVTRGAQPVQPGQVVAGTAQAPLWGLGRTIALEHPELACSRVDLEAGGAVGEADALCLEILADGPEDQIALRGDSRYVARLVRATLPPETTPASFSPDGSYLIVGGLGGVGMVLAHWMVEQGARHVALLGRSVPSAAALQTLTELRAAGAEVVALQCDAARESELSAALAQIKATMPPLRGVIHAAARLDDGLLVHLTPERLATALAPKAHVALNLHALTADCQLDFFVLFSSLAGLLGAPGQANYAAANAFLDALAHHRRALGLPAIGINWGPWAEVGQAAAESNRGQRLALRGLANIPPQFGAAAFGRLLELNLAEVAVMSFNLRQWREFYPAAANAPLLSELAAEQPIFDAAQPIGLMRAALETAPMGQRRQLLEAHLREQIAQVMRLEPAQLTPATPLGSLGLDSLMGLEIRNRLEASLGLTISATLIWTYPTVAALTAHLAETLGLALEEQSAPAIAEPSAQDELRRTAEKIAELSEAEMETLLLQKLERKGRASHT